jgi:putative ATP-grasp target RiPP
MTTHEIPDHGSQSPDQGATSSVPRPWGLTRMRPFESEPTPVPIRYDVDPQTQLGIYYDAVGQTIEAGKHGTIANTQKPHMTNHDGKQSIDGYDADSTRD